MTGVSQQLTRRQAEILDFIRARLARERSCPSVREIAAHFGIASPKGVSDHLSALERKGYLRRVPGLSRNIRLTEPAAGIPLLGRVPAGRPLTMVEPPETYLDLPAGPDHPDVFALRVEGDSMRGIGILDGDYVLVRVQPQVENGAVAVVYVGEEATVKRLWKTRCGWRLQPENPAYAPVEVDASCPDLRVAGPVIGLLRLGMYRSP